MQALCWGGPKHLTVLNTKKPVSVFIFPIELKPSWRLYLYDTGTFGPLLVNPRVRYDAVQFYDGGRFTFEGNRIWTVMVYPENFERQKQMLEEIVNFIIWLCTRPDLLAYIRKS